MLELASQLGEIAFTIDIDIDQRDRGHVRVRGSQADP